MHALRERNDVRFELPADQLFGASAAAMSASFEKSTDQL